MYVRNLRRLNLENQDSKINRRTNASVKYVESDAEKERHD